MQLSNVGSSGQERRWLISNGVAVPSSDTGSTLRGARDPAVNLQEQIGVIRCVVCDVSRSNWGELLVNIDESILWREI